VHKNNLKLLSVCLSSLALILVPFFPVDDYFYGSQSSASLSVLINLLIFWMFLLLAIGFQILLMLDERGLFSGSLSFIDLTAVLVIICFFFVGIGKIVHFSFDVENRVNLGLYNGDPIVIKSRNKAYFKGEIGSKTLESIISLHEQNQFTTLELNSTGGLIQTALEIADFVQSHDISTIVVNECSSACVLIAMSGKKLFTIPAAQFGFHNAESIADPSSQKGRYQSALGSELMFSFLENKRIPKYIIDKAKQTDASSMYYVSGLDFINLRLAMPVR
jgi:hypothetical protein